MKFANKIRQAILPLTLLEMVFGLFLIIFSNDSLSMIIKMLGIIAASYGIVTFAAWLIRREGFGLSVIITSLLGIIAGAFLIFLTDNVREVSTIIFGILAGIFGVSKIPWLFGAKSAGFKQWWSIIIPILVIVGIGVFIGLNPSLSTSSEYSLSMIMLGIALIVGCVADFMMLGGIVHAERHPRAENGEIEAQVASETENLPEQKQ